ncbi:MAG: tripartite tricarboxylate transporter TctB family protein [Alphaproteobacteria bacterium]|nr:tripartite tricarboxylate transporter TctB family protein [Alphaproteobacteria bacterium]
MTPTPMDKKDFVSSLILTVFGIGVMVESARLPRLENQNINPFTVPGLVPGIIGILLVICGLFILIRSTLRGGWRLGISTAGTAKWAKSSAVARSIVTLVLTISYALVLFPLVPFWIATPLFIFSFIVTTEAMANGGWPKPRALLTGLLVAVVAGGLIGYAFQELFFVRLPGG